jgi:hypothetical protein
MFQCFFFFVFSALLLLDLDYSLKMATLMLMVFMYIILDIAGCCFLICPSREEADKAVNAYHNKRTLPGVCGHNHMLVAHVSAWVTRE